LQNAELKSIYDDIMGAKIFAKMNKTETIHI